jgi:hypothetical protein
MQIKPLSNATCAMLGVWLNSFSIYVLLLHVKSLVLFNAIANSGEQRVPNR